jgi:hypothetical protein
MQKNDTETNISDGLPVNSIIMGDIFSGIAISEYCDKIYSYQENGKSVQVIQKAVRLKSDRLCLGLLFLLDEPTRMRIDVLIPENCTNARVSLQEQELIGFFSPRIPNDPDPMIEANCGHQYKISTLHPGEFQSINFRWESGDVLKFYFYFDDCDAEDADVDCSGGVTVTNT